MSLFSWLFPARQSAKVPESSGLSRMEPTRPVTKRANARDLAPNNAQPANRKNERMARRELLYAVVRNAMARAGVLSASYKFKVLSLDARGRQFLVMVDLAREHATETMRLAEIEAMIAQTAKTRHDIVVTAVYWRTNEHVAIGDPRNAPAQRSESRPMPLDSTPATLDSVPAALNSTPAPLAATPVPVVKAIPAPAVPAGGRFEPILADEVAAFKQALATGVASPVAVAQAVAQQPHGAVARAFDGSSKHGPQSYTLLTGFEDTELPESDARSALSRTQYGELT